MKLAATPARLLRAGIVVVAVFVLSVLVIGFVGVELGPPELALLFSGAVAVGSIVAGLISFDR